MRRALGIFMVAVFLLGPLHEWSHQHEIECHEPDCVACQFHNAAMELPPVARIPEARCLARTNLSALPERPGRITDPLAVAPKTSPPQPC